jgi:hypothetical protein
LQSIQINPQRHKESDSCAFSKVLCSQSFRQNGRKAAIMQAFISTSASNNLYKYDCRKLLGICCDSLANKPSFFKFEQPNPYENTYK